MRILVPLLVLSVLHAAAAQDRLFVANRWSGDVSVFSVAADGGLLLAPGSPVAVGEHAVEVAATLDGRTLVAAAATFAFEQTILQVFAVAPDGSLTARGSLQFTGEPRALTIVRRGSRDFACLSLFQQELHVVEVTGGTLQSVPGSPWDSPGFMYFGDSAATPDGRFLYAVKFLGGIRGFAIGADGTPTALAMPALANLGHNHDVAVSPDGRHVYVLNDLFAVVVHGFDRGPDGLLTELPGSPYPAGAPGHSPQAMAFAHGGNALVVTHSSGGAVTVLHRAPDGSLVPAQELFPLEPQLNDVAADGGRVFVIAQGCTECPPSAVGVLSLDLQPDGSLGPADPVAASTGGIQPLDLHLQASAWKDQGLSWGGPAGAPQLAGGGSLMAGTPGALSLSNAAANSPASLLISVVGTPVPFKGGTLLAFPPLLMLPLVTGATGEVALNFVMPAGAPPGSPLIAQAVQLDASAPAGVALSNALLALTP